MRALAHPARLAIMERLMDGVDATATECAEVCGLSPSATSYHLRALARYELVEEAPSRGDARERRWRSRVRGFQLPPDASGDMETQAAEEDLVRVMLSRQDEQARRWLAGSRTESERWREVAAFAETRLLVTPAELEAINQALVDLIAPYRVRSRTTDVPAEARRVRVFYRAFPSE